VKLHRAVTLVVMMLIALVLIGWSLYVGVSTWDARSLTALAIVVAAAAIAGAAFSWRRYFPRKR
jgi:hypothetical protein